MIAPFQTPLTILNGRVTGSRRLVAQSWSLLRIRTVAKALNATVNDIVLAMSGGALRRYLIDHGALPEKPLTAMTPVSFRPADADVEGNSCSVVFASLATELDDPIERLRAIQSSMGEAKRLLKSMNTADIPIFTSIVALPVLVPHLLRISGRTRPTFNVTVSNVPGPQEQLYWNGAPLEGMYPLSIVTHGQALNITVTSCGQSLDFGIVACRRSVPSAQRLIDHLDAALVELERCAALQ
jgi:WS/DGAT/MGAT family acyltransferase